MKRTIFIATFFVAIIVAAGGCNPFAPALDDSPADAQSIITDGKTVEGVFQNIRYAYAFKDTTIYGALLDQNFVFTYRDYETVKDVSWGRDDEMRITDKLFKNATLLSLTWNNIIGRSEDSLQADITRYFTLTITFNPSNIERVDGQANMKLRRASSLLPWKIVQWKDETNF